MNRLHVITLAGLVGLDLAAGAFALNAWTGAAVETPAAARAARPLAPAEAAELPVVELGPDAETLGRPLFVKSRRPPPVGPQASADDAPPPTDMKLRAIVDLDQSPRAYLVANGAAEGKWLSVGDEIGSWKVDSISPMKIALRRESQTVSIGFDYDEVVQTPHAAVAAPPSPPAAASADHESNSAPAQASVGNLGNMRQRRR